MKEVYPNTLALGIFGISIKLDGLMFPQNPQLNLLSEAKSGVFLPPLGE